MWSCTFLDKEGRPSFNTLQNLGSSRAPVFLYVFDILVLAGRNVMHDPLERRRELLQRKSNVPDHLGEPNKLLPGFGRFS